MTRNERQNEGIEKYKKTAIGTGRLCGTLNHATGFGKTTETKKIIEKLKVKQGDFDYLIVVPTSPLQKQWDNRLEKDKHQVLTIQGIISNIDYYRENKIKTYFLVIDEIHKFAAEKFKLIFEVVEYVHILGLTATWNRLDGKHVILQQYCPIIDVITLEEARREGWVADFIEYCYGVDLNEIDQENYENLNEKTNKYLAYFNHDFDLVLGCSSRKNKCIQGKWYIGAEAYVRNNPYMQVYLKEDREAITEEEKIKAVIQKANVCRQLTQERTEFINTATAKLEAVIEVVHLLNMKTVTFGGNFTWTADLLTEKLGDKARSYHSSLETKMMEIPNKKGISKLTKVSGDRQCELAIQDLESNKYSVMNTAKKADLGLDIKGLRAAIIYGRTSDPGVHDQRKGRVTRYEEITDNGELIIKEAIIVNVYIKGTKDETNLKYLLRRSSNVRWINNLNEIQI